MEAVREPRSYLATTARWLLIDNVRRKDIEAAVLDAWASRGKNEDALTPDRIIQAVQMLDAVMRVIDALPGQASMAFLLRRIDGLEQSEIALRLGISLSTVKRHIALAYAQCYAIAYAD